MRIGIMLAHALAELQEPEEEERHLARIQTLASVLDEGLILPQLRTRLWSVYTVHSLPDLAEPLAGRMVATAESGEDEGQQMEAHLAMGIDRIDAGSIRAGGAALHDSARAVWRGRATRLRRLPRL